MAFGMEALVGGTDLLCLGEMGIANTTSASALACALFGGSAAERASQSGSSGSERRISTRSITPSEAANFAICSICCGSFAFSSSIRRRPRLMAPALVECENQLRLSRMELAMRPAGECGNLDAILTPI